MTERDTDDLDALFALARGQSVRVDDALVARVLADAGRLQPQARTVQRDDAPRGGWLRDLLGGWPALSGVLAAGLTGLWVGVAPPAGLEGLAADFIGTTQTVTFLPEPDLSMFEDDTDG